jgi:toxin ParE1/3/4
MAFRIVWTETAAQDLKQIVKYISQDDPEAARRLVSSLLATTDACAEQPFSTRMVPERNSPEIRERIIPPFRIIFAVSGEQEVMHVVRIWHAARGEPEF